MASILSAVFALKHSSFLCPIVLGVVFLPLWDNALNLIFGSTWSAGTGREVLASIAARLTPAEAATSRPLPSELPFGEQAFLLSRTLTLSSGCKQCLPYQSRIPSHLCWVWLALAPVPLTCVGLCEKQQGASHAFTSSPIFSIVMASAACGPSSKLPQMTISSNVGKSNYVKMQFYSYHLLACQFH